MMKAKDLLKNYYDVIILLFGLILYIPLLISSQGLMILEPLAIPFPLTVVLSSFSFLTIIFFIYKSLRKEASKIDLITLTVLVIMVVSNIITILVEPNTITIDTIVRCTYYPNYLEPMSVTTSLSGEIKTIFCICITCNLCYFYISVYLIPRKLPYINIIKVLNYGLIALFVIAFTYSVIAEFDNYINFIKAIFSRNWESHPDLYAAKSFFSHRNLYGMMIIISIISCLINFSIERKKWYIPVIIFMYLYMFFTLCKAGILLITIFLILYYFVYHIIEYKNDRHGHLIYLLVASSIVLVGVITFIILYFANGSFREMFDYITRYNNTITSREGIWSYTIDIVKNGWLVTGRGFGIGNLILFNVNSAGLDDPVCEAHSWFFSILLRGGIIFLLAYIFLLLMHTKTIIYVTKKDKLLGISVLIGLLLFFLYSFIECNYYILFLYLALFNLIHRVYIKKEGIISEEN